MISLTSANLEMKNVTVTNLNPAMVEDETFVITGSSQTSMLIENSTFKDLKVGIFLTRSSDFILKDSLIENVTLIDTKYHFGQFFQSTVKFVNSKIRNFDSTLESSLILYSS